MTIPSLPIAYPMGVVLALAALQCRSNNTLINESKVASMLVTEQTMVPDELHALLRPDTSETAYKPATAAHEQVFAEIIPNLMQLSSPDHPRMQHWNGLAHRIGYTLERWHVGSDIYVVLQELPHRQRGTGTYIVRITAPNSGKSATGKSSRRPTVILQAPHVYFDVDTGKIAIHMFFMAPDRHRIKALFMNSLHRYQTQPGHKQEKEDNPADVCHNEQHLFNTATRLAGEHVTPLSVIQLHGFDGRSDDADREPDVIVSATPSSRTNAIATALEKRFKKRDIRRYPDEFAELGGDTNVQRKLLAGYDGTVFAHIEMSRAFRKYLGKKKKRRNRFTAALIDSIMDSVTGSNSTTGSDSTTGSNSTTGSDSAAGSAP